MSIVHATPGLLDIRAITTFGLHAKPGTDTPIGKFGTGLKYAIATLVRKGCKVRLFIGETEYEFYTKPGDFRGVEFSQVMMRKRRGLVSRWSAEKLPFTTEHGKFWQMWQAFRELHSNTLDEGGKTGIYDNYPLDKEALHDHTTFLIDGQEYVQAYYDRDKTFLPGALTKREGDDRVQVFNEPSNHIYWRGIRVFDLEKPSVYTYNILENMELTEDRTLKYVWDAQSKIAAYVARSKDERLINAVVTADNKKFFEGRLDFDYAYESPSQQFKDVITKKKARGSYVSPMALTYHSRYTSTGIPVGKKTLREQIEHYAYDPGLDTQLQVLFKYLLRCEIKEPVEDDNEIPF